MLAVIPIQDVILGKAAAECYSLAGRLMRITEAPTLDANRITWNERRR